MYGVARRTRRRAEDSQCELSARLGRMQSPAVGAVIRPVERCVAQFRTRPRQVRHGPRLSKSTTRANRVPAGLLLAFTAFHTPNIGARLL